MLSLQAIAKALGGQVSGREVLAPTPGHSRHDRGTAVRLEPGAPDGILVVCFNGTDTDPLMVKDVLRSAGLLPAFGGTRRELTDAERREIRRAEIEREREKAQQHAHGAEKARRCLGAAQPADAGHPYLQRKRIAPERLWQGRDDFGGDGALLVPMKDFEGTVWNVQSILPGRAKEKLYCRGGRTKGLFWHAGKATDRLVIGEGVATVAAIRRATGLPVIAAMTASNLTTIACAVHQRRPDLSLIIAADDDPAGIDAARQAAFQTGAQFVLPGAPTE